MSESTQDGDEFRREERIRCLDLLFCCFHGVKRCHPRNATAPDSGAGRARAGGENRVAQYAGGTG